MKTLNNPYTGTHIEFHIIQPSAVSCLNRDDLGSPKTAMIGNTIRSRVSSQCWKRAVRQSMQDNGVKLGVRTRNVATLLTDACAALGANETQASECGEFLANTMTSKALLFISHTEIQAMANFAKEHDFDKDSIKTADLTKCIKNAINYAVDGLDIALFGRMVASNNSLKVTGAVSFSHAISTHGRRNEIDMFTALDDLSDGTSAESAHKDESEFNSATYYRYISIDLGQLAENLTQCGHPLNPETMKAAIDAFTKALYMAVPMARQASHSSATPWEYANVLVRRGQRMQAPFETPVKSEGLGYLASSIKTLKEWIALKEGMSGSLYGKLGQYIYGEDGKYSIDHLIQDLQQHVE